MGPHDAVVDPHPNSTEHDMFDQHVEHLAQLWEGRIHFSSQSVNYSLSGKRLDIRVEARVLPGHERDWSRVLLSIEDITDRAAEQRRLAASEQYARGLFEHSPVSLWVEDFSADRDESASRIGGDEFAVLTPGADERAGAKMIERIESLVELDNSFYPGETLSFSLGAATCPSGDRLEAMLSLADVRMYDSKRAYYAASEKNRRRT